MEKDLRISEFLKIYGEFLTPRQKEVTESYYDYDLSLKEISENIGISRQAVLDAVHISVKELQRMEEVIGLCAMLQKLKRIDDKMEKQEILDVINSVLLQY